MKEIKDMSYEERIEKRREDDKNGLVSCDDFCGAKKEPETLEEYKATLEHYRDHGFLGGCSHGQ
jgi:hypothetical protein